MLYASPQLTSVGATDSGIKLPVGAVVSFDGRLTDIPSGAVLCDGTNGTPDLSDRMLIGAGPGYPLGTQGGSAAGYTGRTSTDGVHTGPRTLFWPGGRNPHDRDYDNPAGDHSHAIASGTGNNTPPVREMAFLKITDPDGDLPAHAIVWTASDLTSSGLAAFPELAGRYAWGRGDNSRTMKGTLRRTVSGATAVAGAHNHRVTPSGWKPLPGRNHDGRRVRGDHTHTYFVSGDVSAPVYTALGAYETTRPTGAPPGIIVAYDGDPDALPPTWMPCDGTNATPDLRGRFPLGAGSDHALASRGGDALGRLIGATSTDTIRHTHSLFTNTGSGGADHHYYNWRHGHTITIQFGLPPFHALHYIQARTP